MIKNLVVNGCSFTESNHSVTENDPYGGSWASHVNTALVPANYQNLACSGAGNFYISNSTIDYLASNNLDPTETLVVVMWSGSGRKDIRISGEWYYQFENQYPYKAKSGSNDDSEYYLFSGGLTNSWMSSSITKKIFDWSYRLADPVSLCKDSLMHIIALESYLQAHGYQYRFTGYFNQWTDQVDHSQISGDYSLGYFLKDIPIYKNYSFKNWIFADQHRNCLGEFASDLGQLDHTYHPTAIAHQMFAEKIIIPALAVV